MNIQSHLWRHIPRVKRVLPKHKHHFESLLEYKSDDEDANDSDSDSLEDVLDQPPAKRKGLFPTY